MKDVNMLNRELDMTNESLVFKRRLDGRLIAGSIIVGFLLFSNICLLLSYLMTLTEDDIGFYYASLMATGICTLGMIYLIRAKSTTYVIDDTKIVKKDILITKEVRWSEILDIVHYTHTINGILATEALDVTGQGGKVIFRFLYPTHKHYSGSGDLADILQSRFEKRSK